MKILVFTASTGGGHKRAANALKEKIEQLSPECQVTVVDGIAVTGKLYNTFICDGYTLLAKKAPSFYGKIYNKSDQKSTLNSICNTANASHGSKILPIIEEINPDVIISCHAFVTTMLGDLIMRKKLSTPVVAIITDFAPHLTYLADGIEHYVVSSQEMVNLIQGKYNLQNVNIYPYGIPVYDQFSQDYNKEQLCKELDLDPNKKTLLFMAGSFGVSDVFHIYEDVMEKCNDCQLVVITGNNEHLYNRFEHNINENTRLKMYVDNVQDYMHCADLIITKPGGLTVSESIQCNLPMAIYSAFPGQEAENADFLVRQGVAILLQENFGENINELISSPEKLQAMKENCKRIKPKDASANIFNLAVKLAKEHKEKKL